MILFLHFNNKSFSKSKNCLSQSLFIKHLSLLQDRTPRQNFHKNWRQHLLYTKFPKASATGFTWVHFQEFRMFQTHTTMKSMSNSCFDFNNSLITTLTIKFRFYSQSNSLFSNINVHLTFEKNQVRSILHYRWVHLILYQILINNIYNFLRTHTVFYKYSQNS